MIPTRAQIAQKLSQTKTDQREVISLWLDSIHCPTDSVVAGLRVNPRTQILSDLNSYEEYNGS